MLFIVDFILQIRRLLPPLFRKKRWIAWLSSLIKPLIQLYSAPSVLHPVRYPVCLPFPFPSFMALRKHLNLRLSFNGQTIVLERLLNLYYFNNFDSSVPKTNVGYYIYIEDVTNDYEYLFLFLQYEGQPLPTFKKSNYTATPPPNVAVNGSINLAGPQYIYQMSDFYTQEDFIVNVPSWLAYNQLEMESLINTYKLAGTRYKIVTY
jgi:hypothetical protein